MTDEINIPTFDKYDLTKLALTRVKEKVTMSYNRSVDKIREDAQYEIDEMKIRFLEVINLLKIEIDTFNQEHIDAMDEDGNIK